MIPKKTLPKKTKILIIISILSTLALSSILQNNKYFIRAQQYIFYRLTTNKVTMPPEGWSCANIITKDVTVKKDGLYNIYVLLEYDEKYPYHNIYLQCSVATRAPGMARANLKNPSMNNLKENLHNDTLFDEITEYQLFDETTGHPIGMGLWNRKMICMVLKKNVQLYKKHSYKISLQHMMRDEFLSGVRSVKIFL